LKLQPINTQLLGAASPRLKFLLTKAGRQLKLQPINTQLLGAASQQLRLLLTNVGRQLRLQLVKANRQSRRNRNQEWRCRKVPGSIYAKMRPRTQTRKVRLIGLRPSP